LFTCDSPIDIGFRQDTTPPRTGEFPATFLQLLSLSRSGSFIRNKACSALAPMQIHVVSTLTVEDEDRIANTIVKALVDLLNELPISFVLRMETSSSRVLQCTNFPQNLPQHYSPKSQL
jgi:hypothetical protein